MFEYSDRNVPDAEELRDTDKQAANNLNQLQHLMPSLLEATLAIIWADRLDWFFGAALGIYYRPDETAIVPDGFLSLGVDRVLDEELRLSYVMWEEKQIPPILTLEVICREGGGEYFFKKDIYTELEVLYYVIYNTMRRRKPPLEVYRLVDGRYQRQSSYSQLSIRENGVTDRVRERPPMSLRCAVRSASSARGAHRGQASDMVGVSGHDTDIFLPIFC